MDKKNPTTLITNHHVIEECIDGKGKLTVAELWEKPVPAYIVKWDKKNDLAVLATKLKLKPLGLSQSEPWPGYWVMVLGSADWEKVYLEAMKNPRMHARIEVAGMLGLRPGEALGLKWSDLNVDECTLLVERQVQRARGKGLVLKEVKQKTVRTLKISQETVQILVTHKRHQSLNKAKWTYDHDLIFPNTVGKLGDEKSDRLAFKNLLTAAGVPDCQLYQLRKTAFTAMAGQTDLKTLMEFSGHTQVSTVIGNYVFATSESMKSAINGMEKLRPVAK